MSILNTVKRREPAVGIGASATALLYAGFGILQALGIVVPEDLATHVNALVLALCAIPAVSGYLTRFFVVSPNTADRIANGQNAAVTPPTNVQPTRPTQPTLAETSEAGAT